MSTQSYALELQVSIAECAKRLCGRGELGHVRFVKSVVQIKPLALRRNVGCSVMQKT